MFRRLSTIAVIAVTCICTSQLANAQFGGLQLQIGGFGNGVGVYNGYGTGYYSNYGTGFYNGYGNRYSNYGYGTPLYNGGYYNNGLPSTGLYPSFGTSYAVPYYYAPVRPYPIRRFRYR